MRGSSFSILLCLLMSVFFFTAHAHPVEGGRRMMFCLLYGIGSTGAKKSLERQLHESEIHPLLWKPETFGLPHHLCSSNRAGVAKPKRETKTADI
jgi:hypothetical protein